jgi:hypothetical protein
LEGAAFEPRRWAFPYRMKVRPSMHEVILNAIYINSLA